MGHKDLWEVKQERDRIYSLAEMSEDEGMKVAELEVTFAEMDGYIFKERFSTKLHGDISGRNHYNCL